MEDKEYRSDCEVCTRLIKEKHKFDYLWKIACVILAALVIVLSILYFGRGSVVKDTDIQIDNTTMETQGDNGTIIIGGEEQTFSGTVTETDYTPILCITIIASAVIIVVGGIIIAHHFKRND